MSDPVRIADSDVIESWDQVDSRTSRPPLVVLEPLLAFLDERGLGSGSLTLEPLGDGHSNVTLLLRRGTREFVLRRPPRPPVPPSAHDVIREAKILQALDATDVPTPRVLAVGDDPSLIGAPFYVMERRPGVTVTPELGAPFDSRRDGQAIGRELARGLAAIHGVDWRAVGLAEFARPDGYVERQIRRFLGLWEVNRTRDLPEVEDVAHWLRAHRPPQRETTLIHGDYRLGNMLFTLTPPTLSAVLDWEMSTIGDPLADLGFMLSTWSQADDEESTFDLSPTTRLPGFPTRRDMLEAYARASGRDVPDPKYYVVFSLWKAIVYMEGNFKRARAGLSDDPFLQQFEAGVSALARRASDLGPKGLPLDA